MARNPLGRVILYNSHLCFSSRGTADIVSGFFAIPIARASKERSRCQNLDILNQISPSQIRTPGKSGPLHGSVSTGLTTSPEASNTLGYPFGQSDLGFPVMRILVTSKTTDHGKIFEDADSEKILNSFEFEQNLMHDKDTDSGSKGSNYSNKPARDIGTRNCCLLEAVHWDALCEGRATGREECMVSAEDSAEDREGNYNRGTRCCHNVRSMPLLIRRNMPSRAKTWMKREKPTTNFSPEYKVSSGWLLHSHTL